MLDKFELAILRKSIRLLNMIPELKKVSNTNGGEYAGKCPFCRGTDRFRLQPFNAAGGIWFCRGCSDGRWQDIFVYFMRLENISFGQANNKVKSIAGVINEPVPQAVKEEFIRDTWQKTGLNFIEKARINLFKPEGQPAREWLHYRGLNDETIESWGLGCNLTSHYQAASEWGGNGKDIFFPAGVVIPCYTEFLHYIKIRQLTYTKVENKNHIIRGSQGYLFGGKSCQKALTAFLFESELDAILGWQHFPGAGYCSLPAGRPMKNEYLPVLSNVKDVIVAYDNDLPGQIAADELCKMNHFFKADKLPHGKDLTEFALAGGDVFSFLYEQIGKIPGEFNG